MPIPTNNRKLKVGALFTDLHLGKRGNSKDHNDDCLNYVVWFCKQVRANPDIDHIIFMGDFHENRAAINILTLNYSHRVAEMLNALGLPIFWCVGNHDLHQRHTRDIHSVITHSNFENIILVNEPKVFECIHGTALVSPFLFHEEYDEIATIADGAANWFGHFEFKGFQVTGNSMLMPTGPDAADFTQPRKIYSGHYHKRQQALNVCYIGNTFPMDFSDAGDNARGMAIADLVNNTTTFIDWADCPKYARCRLSDIIDGAELPDNARVKCIVDVPISFEESTILRQSFVDNYSLREFVLEESKDVLGAITSTAASVDVDQISSVDDLVIAMLQDINIDQIDNAKLIQIYNNLKL